MQGLERKKELGGHTITARQPTLAEMINFFQNPPSGGSEFDVVDHFLLSDLDMAVSDLLMLSDATPEVIKQLTEDQVVELAKHCKEVNPRFFQIRSLMLQAGREIAAQPQEG
jgi:hypothetical protein